MDEETLRQRRREKILARSGLSPVSPVEKVETPSEATADYKKIQISEEKKVKCSIEILLSGEMLCDILYWTAFRIFNQSEDCAQSVLSVLDELYSL
jgi:hypothetical protein